MCALAYRCIMKKNLEKIFASCSIVVAVILIMVLVVAAFGGIEPDEFNSKLVRGLIVTLAILYIVLAVVSLVLIFVNSDVVKEITIRQEKGGSVRVSSQVVSKLVKQSCKQVEGVKCQKVVLVTDEYGVRLKLNVKVVDKDVVESETYVRTLLEDVFLGEFGFKFSSIEIKVMALTPKYKADEADIQSKVEAKLAQLKAEEARQETVAEAETETAAEEAPVEENAEDVQDVAEETAARETVETVESVDEAVEGETEKTDEAEAVDGEVEQAESVEEEK